MEYGAVLGNDSKETPEKRILSQSARTGEVAMGIASLHPSYNLPTTDVIPGRCEASSPESIYPNLRSIFADIDQSTADYSLR